MNSLRTALADRYRIERELGAGGMATVYLAYDVRHDRRVALKVLKPELAAVIGAERFLREIKTSAGLQHPHILGLIDSGEVEGTAYFVMPFVEGESLRDLLLRETQLSVAGAVRIASEVASALDYAHRHGVIHRDIKPENILLHDGQALVADFGIALAVSAGAGERMTQTGMSLGTPHYMSPEQAMGERDITARSDLYSLGCVLYEMLVGEPPFTGPTAQAIVAKVMTEKPPAPSRLRDTVPAAVDDAVLTALQKLPADRFASAAAFGDALRNYNAGTATVRASRANTRATVGKTGTIAAAVACMAIGAVASAFVIRRWTSPSLTPNAERQQATYSGRATRPAVSPDGRFLAYLETRCPDPPAQGGCVSLQVLEVGSTRPVEIISGAERLVTPRWTHDGLTLVVAGTLGPDRTGLFTIPRLGGTPRRLADEPAAYDTHPTADSVALVTLGDTTLRVVALASGEFAGAAVRMHVRPPDIAWSPDGSMFAFTVSEGLQIIRRSDGEILSSAHVLARDHVRWSVDRRHVLTFRWTAGQEDDFIALPVSANGRPGAAILLASLLPTMLTGDFDVARATGRVVTGGGAQFNDIWTFDLSRPNVTAHRLTQGTNWFGAPVLSADGRNIYYLRADPLGNSLYRVTDGREMALTSERQVVNSSLRLSLDERTIAFESNIDSSRVLVLYDVASGTSRRVPRTGATARGWPLPGDAILWTDPLVRSLSISNAHGASSREIPVQPTGADSSFISFRGSEAYGTWALAPDAGSTLLVGQYDGGLNVVRVPLRGGAAQTLGRFPSSEGGIGIVGWTPDGAIHLARTGTATATTSLLAMNATTGVVRLEAVLPVACDQGAVTYSPAARRAACRTTESRADIMILDGIRP